MSRFVLALGAIGCGVTGLALAGCSFEHRTVLNNTAYEGRYTDGDFAEKDAGYAVRELAASLRDAGFSVTRRSAERLLVDQEFVVTPGRWLTVDREVVVNPETGKTETNVTRRYEQTGEAISLTITGDVVVERGRDGMVRAVRYQIWPESPRVYMPIAGGPAETAATPHDVFTGAIRDVVRELGVPLEDENETAPGTKASTTDEGADVDG